MIQKINTILQDIWLGFSAANDFRNKHQQWPKL